MIINKIGDEYMITADDGSIILDHADVNTMQTFLAVRKATLVDRKRSLLSQVADTITQIRDIETRQIV